MSLLDENIEIPFETLLEATGWKKEYRNAVILSGNSQTNHFYTYKYHFYTYKYSCDITTLYIEFHIQLLPKGYYFFNGIGRKGYKNLRKPIMSVQILSHNIYSPNGMSQTFWIKNCEDVVGDIMEFIKKSHWKEEFKERYGRRYIASILR